MTFLSLSGKDVESWPRFPQPDNPVWDFGWESREKAALQSGLRLGDMVAGRASCTLGLVAAPVSAVAAFWEGLQEAQSQVCSSTFAMTS